MQSELQNSKQQMQRNKISRGATKVLHIFQKGIHNTEHGITLVALIITVIVLLILAMVSIRLVMNGGIIDKAEKGTESYSAEEELEQIKLAVASAKLAGNGFLTEENLNTELQKVFKNTETVSENSDYYGYKTEKNYKIYKDGTVKEIEPIIARLPAEYQEVEYIESTGTQYIDTRIIPNLSTGVSVLFSDFNNASWSTIFGCVTAYQINSRFRISTEETNMYAFLGDKIKIRLQNFNDIKIDFNIPKGQLNYNGIKYNITNTTFNLSNLSITLLAENNLNNGISTIRSFSSLRMKKCKIYDDAILLRDFIPCYSTTTVTDANGTEKTANTKGLYDTVEGKFYTNQGSGDDFIAGPNV